MSFELERYKDLKAYFEGLAVHRTVENLVREFSELRLELYAPVKNQLAIIVRSVNQRRKAAGFERVPLGALQWRRFRALKTNRKNG